MIVKNQFVFIKGFFHREDEKKYTLHFISSQNHIKTRIHIKREKRDKNHLEQSCGKPARGVGWAKEKEKKRKIH